MNIRELELFRHLASSLHFGRTSLECNITPSGLTRTIQRLENEVGKPLFFRNNRSVHLSPAGILFKDYCEETLSRYNLFRSHLKSDTTLRGRTLPLLFCYGDALYPAPDFQAISKNPSRSNDSCPDRGCGEGTEQAADP